jgi:hypothetical protein
MYLIFFVEDVSSNLRLCGGDDAGRFREIGGDSNSDPEESRLAAIETQPRMAHHA